MLSLAADARHIFSGSQTADIYVRVCSLAVAHAFTCMLRRSGIA